MVVSFSLLLRQWLPVLCLALMLAGTATASQAKRVALVIGNGAYQHAVPLRNPVADGQAIEQKLTALGFEVISGYDLTKTTMRETLARFAKAARDSEVSLFFYAGHGMQADGKNYLLPVDAHLEDELSLDFETVDVNFILRQMERSSKTRIAILDACRDNPMAAVLAKNASGPPIRSGLAEIAVDTAGAGTVIAFATSPGKAAYDGEGPHSPFTTALLNHIDAPDTNIQTMFTRVTGDVYRNTAKQQRPWVNASLVTEVFLNKSVPVVQAPSAQAAPASQAQVALSTSRSTAEDAEELQAFEKALVAGDAAALRAFVDQYPQSPRATEARTMIAGLTEGDTSAVQDPVKKGNLLILPGEDSPIKFTLPLRTGPYPVNGQSLQALAQGQPLFSPIEGLPPSVWKDKQCSTCHQWDKTTLCDQGNVYARAEPGHMLRKQHPYGGPFKLALRNWSKTGCQ